MNFKDKLHSMIPTQPRNRQLFFTATIIGVALLTSASIFATGPSASPAKDTEKAWPVSVTSAQLQELHPSVSVFGKLEASRIARLRSDLVARVSAVYVHEGDWVNQGDTLVELNNRETQLVVLERQADLQQHTANLSSMRSQLELEQQSTQHFQSRFEVVQAKLTRHKDLMEKRLISKSLLDEIVSQSSQASIEYRNHVRELTILPNQISAHEAQVAKAQVLLEQAKLDLAKTVIVAPFAGPVLAVHTAPGDHSNLSVVLVEIADASSFEVRIQVPDSYARQFQQAKQLNHSITAIGDQGQVFTLLRLAGHVRAGQTGLDAFFKSPQNSQTLGRVFNLTIQLPAQNNLIAVPVQSIYADNRVYGVRDRRLVSYQIQRVGERETAESGYQILIRSDDIIDGEKIITTQLPRAITGLLVEVVNQGS